MKEAELRTDVLLPLFIAMGFRDVHHHHGGPGEKGKDIVMWYPTPLGGREYYAAVVKAGPISGQATGSGSAGEVFVQVSQALGSKFTDPTDLQSRTISKCIVITPHDIRKEAAEALKAALGAQVEQGTVQLIGGQKLWEWLERYSPERAVASQLQFASQVLDNLSPHHRVVARLEGGSVQLGIEPKHKDAATVEPLTISADFEFPATPSGKAVNAAFDSHIRRGTPVTIPGAFIRRLELPQILQPFFAEPIAAIHLGPAHTDRVIHASVVARTNGEEREIAGVRLGLVRVGTDEIELQSTERNAPWAFEIVLNRVTKHVQLNMRFGGSNSNAKRLAEAAHFADVLSRGGQIAVINDATGLELFSLPVNQGAVSGTQRAWIDFLDSLLFIQQHCKIEIPLPADEISFQDAKDVIDLAAKLQAGIWEGKASSVSLTLKPGPIPDEFLNVAQDGTRLVAVREEWFEVFGVTIPLGHRGPRGYTHAFNTANTLEPRGPRSNCQFPRRA